MSKKVFGVLAITVIMLGACFSCTQEAETEAVIDSEASKLKIAKINIESIEKANNDELNLVTNFLNDILLTKNVIINFNPNSSTLETVRYTELEGKALVLSYKNDPEKSFIFIVYGNNEITTWFKHEKIDYENSFMVKTYIEQNEWFIAEVDKNTEELISFNLLTHSNAKSWWECASSAVSACANDGECAFMCGLVAKYCLGAIGIACLF